MRYFFPSVAIFLLAACSSQGQTTPNQSLNLGFEKTNTDGRIIGCSFPWNKDGYFSFKDDNIKVEGKYSIRLEKDANSKEQGFGNVMFSLPAGYKGKQITLKGFIRTEN